MTSERSAIPSPTDKAPPHESARLHVSGQALYADDIALPADTLHASFGISGIAHARIRTLDLAPVLSMPGVASIAVAQDIPG
jgi:xanthine dehydrogenase large subunit